MAMHETLSSEFIGYVDGVETDLDRTRVRGWAVCLSEATAGWELAAAGESFSPTQGRLDVAKWYETSDPRYARCGFDFSIPYPGPRLTLSARASGREYELFHLKVPDSAPLSRYQNGGHGECSPLTHSESFMQNHEALYQEFIDEVSRGAIDDGLVSGLWRDVRIKIRNDSTRLSKFEFLRWPSLGDFSVPEAWVPARCFDELVNSREWSTKWFGLTRDSKVGCPKDFSKDFGTSPILLQHVYHLFRYEHSTGRRLIDCDIVLEVGAGYGSFCRLLKNYGFKGLHIIFDLPEVLAIQRLYLSLIGIRQIELAEYRIDSTQHAFALINDAQIGNVFELLKRMSAQFRGLRIAFVATWSLSETPAVLREKFFPSFLGVANRYLMAYQPVWREIDNDKYFHDVHKQSHYTWTFEEMSPSTYVFL